MAAPHDDAMAEETRGLGYPATSDDGFALVEGDDTPPEDDFLLLDTPGTSIAGDRDEAESKEQLTNLLLASDYSEVPDELCTKAFLDSQLESLTATIRQLLTPRWPMATQESGSQLLQPDSFRHRRHLLM